MKSYWVYMFICDDGHYYIGITNDVDRRVAQHNDPCGDLRCFTFSRRPVSLVYSTEFADVRNAIDWEKQIKKWSRKKKAALARGDFKEIRKLASSKS